MITNSEKELTKEEKQKIKVQIIQAYDAPVIRIYCTIRFLIMNMRIIEEIEQHLPGKGYILDVGCGFGLFSIFFASCNKTRKFISLDINKKRIEIARRVSQKLNIANRVTFYQCDVSAYNLTEKVNAIVTLDLLHHLPQEIVPVVLNHFSDALDKDGILLIKDVTSKPWGKMAFTWILDKLLNFCAPLHYYSKDEMVSLLEKHGFKVKCHHMLDILPYPHILYICSKV
jgi:ubiquinone/menaquinone biosynthesis C-methylase UbiE